MRDNILAEVFSCFVVEGYNKLEPNVKVQPVLSSDDKAIQALREKEEE